MPDPMKTASMPAGTRDGIPWLLVSLPTLVLVVFFAMPNILLLSASFLKSESQQLTSELTLGNYLFVLGRPQYLGALWRTFEIGFLVGLIDVVLAYPIAYFLVRTKSRWGAMCLALALAPLLASVVVRTYGWHVILDRDGILSNIAVAFGISSAEDGFMPSVGAIVIGLAHALLPYPIITIMGSLKGVNTSLESAAMSLGASRFRTFLTVLLPLTLPGIAGGFLLAFSISISAYATPMILGGPGTATIATLMYMFMMMILDWSVSSTLAVVLVVTALVLLMLSARLGAKQASL